MTAAAGFDVEIATPLETRRVADVRYLELPGARGRFAVLPGHAPLMAALAAGPCTVETRDGVRRVWTLGSGTVRVEAGEVVLLVRSAAPAS